MAVVMTAIFLFALPIYGNASKIITLEQRQAECIQMVYEIGSQVEAFGDTWGETVASIAYQESWCNSSRWQTNGVVVGDLNSKGTPRSLGIMQVQIPTAREVGKKFPHIFKDRYGERRPSDEEIAIDLLIDNKFNATVGIHYYVNMLNYRKGDWDFAILSYNRGTGKVLDDINNYVYMVKKWRTTVIIPFIKGNYKIKDVINEEKRYTSISNPS